MDLRTIIFVILFGGLFIVIFLFRIRYFRRYAKLRKRILREKELFLATFDPARFVNFEAFTFQLGSFSHIGPFPAQEDGEWRYTVYLAASEAEDIETILHEITECTVGRLIESLLELKKPLYLHRRQDEKFWVTGQRQKYILEHVLASMSEFNDVSKNKQEERLASEDIEKWQLGNAKSYSDPDRMI